VPPQQLQDKLTDLIQKAIRLKDLYKDCPQVYMIGDEDTKFALEELAKEDAVEGKLDALAKLFIAFYLDYIPTQIVSNLENNAGVFKNSDTVKDYFLTLAGFLHEAKIILLEEKDNMLPYLMAYKEYLGERGPNAVNDADLIDFFASIIDSAIQAIITF